MLVAAALAAFAGCNRQKKASDFAYVGAAQANLRDRVAALYNKTGTLKNGERVEILERSRRFVRVRNDRGETGWIEERYLVGGDVYRQLQQLALDNRKVPVQAHGIARSTLRMHVTPGRDTPSLIQLAEDSKVDIIKRATIEKQRPQAALNSTTEKDSPAPPMEDWLFVRDSEGQVGWVLARMVDIDIPLEVAQYSEGQRIVADFVLNKVHDNDAPSSFDDPSQHAPRDVPQFLVLYTEPKDGMPWDYDQIRVFTWNLKRHRYETAYRERKLFGLFPAKVGTEDFGKDGVLPVFILRIRKDDGQEQLKKYRLLGPIVRRVLAPGEEAAEKNQRVAHPRRNRR
jgi:SH3-like domain-containing protein